MSEQKPKQRDANRTKNELLIEATRAFAESGFSGARVDEIAHRAHTTKRMIYYYFENKEGLYLEVLKQSYRRIRAAEQALDVVGLDPVTSLRQIAELTYDHHLENSEFIRLIAAENMLNGRFVKRLDSVRELGDPALGVLETILTKGAEAGVFRQGIDPLDVHLMISSYCVFQVANQHTFGYLFGVDLHAPDRSEHYRSLIGDVVVAWSAHP